MLPRATPPVPAGGDQNKGITVEIVTWVFTSLALITVFLRLFTRLRLTRTPGWDDFWIVLGMVFNLAYTIIIEVAVKAGNGRHAYYLKPAQLSDALRWNTIAFIPGVMSFSIPKMGVAILLMRLMNPSRIQRYIMYFLATCCIIGSILCAIFLWQQCSPPSMLWHPIPTGTCWHPSILVNFATSVGAFSAFTDIYFAAYPCAVVYKLNVSTKKKIGLGAVLSLGFVAGIITIYKSTRIQGFYDRSDYIYSTTDLLIWTSIESSFIIIAADLPTLRPLFLLITDHSPTSGGRANRQRRSSYKLGSVSKDTGPRVKRGPPRAQYPLDTVDLMGPDSAERILPPNRIRKTLDVHIARDDGAHQSGESYV